MANAAVWLTVPECAERLRCGRRAIYRAIKASELKACVLNNRGDLRVSEAWLEDFVEQHSTVRESFGT